MHITYCVKKACEEDVRRIVRFIDSTFTKEGYGFVTSSQINTETKRGAVWIATLPSANDRLIGVRVGKNRVYNLAVDPAWRGKGVGRSLIEANPPDIIRVKAQPVGHLSKKQLDGFTTPVGFYHKIGYIFSHLDFARNFWQRGKGKESHFHKQGDVKHIQIWKRRRDIE